MPAWPRLGLLYTPTCAPSGANRTRARRVRSLGSTNYLVIGCMRSMHPMCRRRLSSSSSVFVFLYVFVHVARLSCSCPNDIDVLYGYMAGRPILQTATASIYPVLPAAAGRQPLGGHDVCQRCRKPTTANQPEMGGSDTEPRRPRMG